MTSDVICSMDAHTADPAEMEILAKINSNAKHPPKDLHVCRLEGEFVLSWMVRVAPRVSHIPHSSSTVA